MFRKGRWDNVSDEDLLSLLEEEIIRIGLKENPTKTLVQKYYNRERIPSPSWYINKFGSWEEIIGKTNLEYDKKKQYKKASFGEKDSAKWRDISDQALINIVVDEMRRTKETRAKMYQEVRDKKSTPSLNYIYHRGIKWKDVKQRYKETYLPEE